MTRPLIVSLVVLAAFGMAVPPTAGAANYYVRQTVGDDARDGSSPATAWRSVGRLTHAMHAGDTAYVGPGLYREQIVVVHDGSSDARITFVADASGRYTGDPPGTVMITGADPVDETVFSAAGSPGVYRGEVASPVVGVVEMDGPQRRYTRARDTKEAITDKLPEREVVAKLPASHFYDADAKTLYLHTSDGEPPAVHEIELIHRGNGIAVSDRHFVTVTGFVFRHMGDAGISFFKGASDGVASGNVSYGGRQGIRVYGATRIVVQGNTLFRNDNSGVYFALESSDGQALGNVAYENVKGLRWSSGSANAVADGNVVFDNREAGIALEDVAGARLRRNALIHNPHAQLMLIRSVVASDENCFVTTAPDELVADFVFGERYTSLADYRRAHGQDQQSRADGCAPPPKLDVRALHAETLAYAERARALLASALTTPAASPSSGTPPEH